MSYNITSVSTKRLDAWMLAEDVVALAEREDELPECSFLQEMLPVAEKALAATQTCRCGVANDAEARFCKGCGKKLPKPDPKASRIVLPNFWWYGEGSGHAWDFLTDEVAPKVMGAVEAVFTWEGGDSHSGLVVEDGVVTECKVELVLVRPEEP